MNSILINNLHLETKLSPPYRAGVSNRETNADFDQVHMEDLPQVTRGLKPDGRSESGFGSGSPTNRPLNVFRFILLF